MEAGAKKIRLAAEETFRIKLGFLRNSEKGTELWQELEPLMRTSDQSSLPLCSRKMFAMQQLDSVSCILSYFIILCISRTPLQHLWSHALVLTGMSWCLLEQNSRFKKHSVEEVRHRLHNFLQAVGCGAGMLRLGLSFWFTNESNPRNGNFLNFEFPPSNEIIWNNRMSCLEI